MDREHINGRLGGVSVVWAAAATVAASSVMIPAACQTIARVAAVLRDASISASMASAMAPYLIDIVEAEEVPERRQLFDERADALRQSEA